MRHGSALQDRLDHVVGVSDSLGAQNEANDEDWRSLGIGNEAVDLGRCYPRQRLLRVAPVQETASSKLPPALSSVRDSSPPRSFTESGTSHK